MEKKEFKIGEVFLCGLVKLKCIKSDCVCEGCYLNDFFYNEEECRAFVGDCTQDREDETDVIFVKVEE